MPQSHYLIYHEFTYAGGLEWATKYCWVGAAGVDADALAIAEAEAGLVHQEVNFTRWEFVNASGVKSDQGTFSGVNGTWVGDVLPIKYAALLRLNVGSQVKRPSFRYIHGLSEGALTAGTSSAAFDNSRAAYTTALLAAGGGSAYLDSDGQAVVGHGLRGFTMRHRMRRKTI